MDRDNEQMIKVNVHGRVFITCQSRGVTDPATIGYYVEIVEQAVTSMLTDESTADDFQCALEDQIAWLEEEIDRTGKGNPESQQEVTDNETTDTEKSVAAEESLSTEEKEPTGYVPEAKSMPERLKDKRSIMEHLLDNDCITLKLVTPKQAKAFKRGLLGKKPESAEEEVVTALRTVLHNQIRKFIRQHNGGPWASPTVQHEVRMDITRTKTLRSLVTLARELLAEREEWLDKNKGSITGRLFGGRVKMDN
jgi:hypothetical protein